MIVSVAELDRCIHRAIQALDEGDYDTYNRLVLLASEIGAKLSDEEKSALRVRVPICRIELSENEQTTEISIPTGNR